MYCELLAESVKKLKNEPTEAVPTAVLELGFSTYIPKNYIPSDKSRMEVYRKIAVVKSAEGLKHIEAELADVYGPVPDEVKLLLEMAELRISAGKWDIKSIVAAGVNLIFSFSGGCTREAESLFAGTARKVRAVDKRTVYLQLERNYFEPRTLINVIRKILSTTGADSI